MLVWTGIAGLTGFLLWPAMWVDPIGTLQNVFGGAFRYALEGNLSAIYFNRQIIARGDLVWNFYPLVLIWRATPGMLAGWRWITDPSETAGDRKPRLVIVTLLLYAVLFTLAVSLSSQKYDRYLLPAWLALLLLAGWGWAGLLAKLGRLLTRRRGPFAQAAAGLLLSLALLAGQGADGARLYPYYYSYYNPLLGGLDRAAQVMMVGWGEGLDEAGMVLDALPNAGGLRVMSWYGDGSFSYFFQGRTVAMYKRTSLAEVKQMDYVVLYYQQIQRQEPSPEILDFLASLSPIQTIRVDGLELVQIYKLKAD